MGNIHTVGPNEALIVSGRFFNHFRNDPKPIGLRLLGWKHDSCDCLKIMIAHRTQIHTQIGNKSRMTSSEPVSFFILTEFQLNFYQFSVTVCAKHTHSIYYGIDSKRALQLTTEIFVLLLFTLRRISYFQTNFAVQFWPSPIHYRLAGNELSWQLPLIRNSINGFRTLELAMDLVVSVTTDSTLNEFMAE